MKPILTEYLSQFVTGIIALALGWIGKGKIQKRSDNADLTAKIQSVYKDMVSDQDAFMDELRKEVMNLKKKQTEIDNQWRTKIQQVEKKWQTKYSRLQTRHNDLLKEFEAYKANHK